MSEVPNAYREALGDILPSVRGQAMMPGIAFYDVIQALEAGAWTSADADTFSGELSSNESTARDHGEACREAFESRHGSEPVEVPEGDERARWL